MEPKANFPKTWIFLRGLTRGAFHWLGFEKKFQAHFKNTNTFTPDLAGNGSLHEEISNTDIDQAVHQVRNLIPESALKNKKVGLLTISMGGMIGTRWAEMFPDEVSHLVLINSSFASLSPFYRRLRVGNYPQLIKTLIQSDANQMENFILRTTSNFEENWRPHLNDIVQFHQRHPVTAANFFRQLKMAGQTDFQQKPTANTLILASENDRLVHFDCSQVIAKTWNVPIEIHPSAGHDLPLDAPDWIFEKLQKNFCSLN